MFNWLPDGISFFTFPRSHYWLFYFLSIVVSNNYESVVAASSYYKIMVLAATFCVRNESKEVIIHTGNEGHRHISHFQLNVTRWIEKHYDEKLIVLQSTLIPCCFLQVEWYFMYSQINKARKKWCQGMINIKRAVLLKYTVQWHCQESC